MYKKMIMLAAILITVMSLPAIGDEGVKAFMEKVLKNRLDTWSELHDYVFKEKAEVTISGEIDSGPLQTNVMEYRWFVKDGYMIRSPHSINGVEVDQDYKEKEEEEWIEHLKKGEKKGDQRERFFGLNLKDGTYYFAGRETYLDHEVVVIEFYPDSLFDVKKDGKRQDAMESALSNASMVTLYVLPDKHLIVKMVMNISHVKDQPFSWLVRINNITMTMKMGLPVGGDIWAPVEIIGEGTADTAATMVKVHFKQKMYDYKKTAVKVKFRYDPIQADGDNNNEKK